MPFCTAVSHPQRTFNFDLSHSFTFYLLVINISSKIKDEIISEATLNFFLMMGAIDVIHVIKESALTNLTIVIQRTYHFRSLEI
jgi:hypothetical protein